jgi:hypothetical protein
LAWDARNNLRQVLFNIRHTLMDAAGHDTIPTLVSDRQAIQFNPDADLDIDLHKFDRLLEGTRVHDHLNLAGYETYCEALQDAVNLYQGAFLSDFYLEDSNQFEDWTQAIGEAYRRKALDTLAFGYPCIPGGDLWGASSETELELEGFFEDSGGDFPPEKQISTVYNKVKVFTPGDIQKMMVIGDEIMSTPPSLNSMMTWEVKTEVRVREEDDLFGVCCNNF